MKRDLFLATFSDNALDVIKKYGIGIEFNQFCISSDLDDEKRDDTVAGMKKELEYCGIRDMRKAIVHGPFTELIPAAIDHLAREYAMCRYDQAFDGVQKLGLNRMVVHSGYVPFMYFPVWHVEKSIEFWSRFLADKPDDFTVYIENVVDTDPHTFVEIVEGVRDPRLKICLDVGHANAMESPYDVLQWIEIMGKHIGHFHLHNNDGKGDQHLPVMEGSIPMEEVLKAIDSFCSPEATITVESRDCESSIAWLLERL